MKRIGKIGKINLKANQKLKEIFLKKNISKCEACGSKYYVISYSFHHRKPRKEYYKELEKLGDFNEVLLLCNTCHDIITKNKPMSDLWFKQLRGA